MPDETFHAHTNPILHFLIFRTHTSAHKGSQKSRLANALFVLDLFVLGAHALIGALISHEAWLAHTSLALSFFVNRTNAALTRQSNEALQTHTSVVLQFLISRTFAFGCVLIPDEAGRANALLVIHVDHLVWRTYTDSGARISNESRLAATIFVYQFFVNGTDTLAVHSLESWCTHTDIALQHFILWTHA